MGYFSSDAATFAFELLERVQKNERRTKEALAKMIDSQSKLIMDKPQRLNFALILVGASNVHHESVLGELSERFLNGDLLNADGQFIDKE